MFKLRTLSGLLAFDAAARHGSLTLAAKELGRTQSAVSQQVKALEQEVGLELFVRRPREVVLTPAGKALAQSVQVALGDIETTVNELSQKDDPNILRLTTYQSFAIHWLIPRLPRFSLLHPEIDVRINADDARLDLCVEGYDLAVRVGAAPSGALTLSNEIFVPVYAPILAEGGMISGKEISKFRLLSHKHKHQNGHWWHDWLSQNGLILDDMPVGTDYSHSGLLVQAAAAGGGVALAPMLIAAEAIASGRLKCIKGKPLVTEYSYYIETAKRTQSRKVSLFVDWIRSEMTHMEQGLSGCIE